MKSILEVIILLLLSFLIGSNKSVDTGFESKNDEVEETTEGNEESSNQNNNVLVDSENYFDTPPLMRDYIVQYQLN
jgi:cell division protein FtsZ